MRPNWSLSFIFRVKNNRYYEKKNNLKGEIIMKKTRKKRIHSEIRKNKIVALILILIGVLSVKIDGDATFAVICAMFGLPLFFAKQNWIE